MNYKHLTKLLIFLGLFIFCFSFFYCVKDSIPPQSSMDASFYHIMTDQLENGKGFQTPFIWHHLKSYSKIEHPMDYWMPLGVIYYYLSRMIAGIRGEILLNILVWSVLSLFIYIDILKATKSANSALVGFFTFVFCGRNIFYVLTTDNNALYALLGYSLIQLLCNKNSSHILIGLVSGLMVLDRIEGTIFALVAALYQWRKHHNIKSFFLVIIITLLVVSPWIVRNKIVLDTLWPSNSKALFMTKYADMFNQDFIGDVNHYLDKGVKWIVREKLDSLKYALTDLIAVPGMFILYPIWLLGIIFLWKKEGKIFSIFITLFWLICGLVFTVQTRKGTSLHISAAFIPHVSIFIGAGLHYLFAEKKFNLPVKILISLFIVFWAIIFSSFSLNKLNLTYNNDNQPYNSLLQDYKIPLNESIVSFYPVYIYGLNNCKGVMASEDSIKGPIELADKFKCNYFLDDSRLKFKRKIDTLNWQLVATNEHFPINTTKTNKTKLSLYKRITKN